MATKLDNDQRARAERPSHVPIDRVYEIDMYALEGIEAGYHEAWKQVAPAGTPVVRLTGDPGEDVPVKLEDGWIGVDLRFDVSFSTEEPGLDREPGSPLGLLRHLAGEGVDEVEVVVLFRSEPVGQRYSSVE